MSGTDYKIRARGKWDWKKFDTVRLPVSVGQPYHEGAKMQAVADWVRRNFTKRIIILGDAPQRYNLMFKQGYSEEMAHAAAVKAGDEWLERNRPYLHGIETTRWDEWKNKTGYPAVKDQIYSLYATNPHFYHGLRDAATELWARRYAGESYDEELFFALSEKFLLEETTVFAVAYDALGGISAYPGDFLKIWERFIDVRGQTIPAGLRKAYCTRLHLRKRKSLLRAGLHPDGKSRRVEPRQMQG